jgi:hypothetical protein
MATSAALEPLIALLAGAFDRPSWHGTNLRGSVRRLDAAAASWRPAPGRHNIQEIVVHAAYWKYAVRRRLTGGRRGSFALEGSNWFARSDTPAPGLWRDDVARLIDEHAALLAAVSALPPSRIRRRLPNSAWTVADLIRGAAAHDLYHAGQIQLIKALRRASPGSR